MAHSSVTVDKASKKMDILAVHGNDLLTLLGYPTESALTAARTVVKWEHDWYQREATTREKIYGQFTLDLVKKYSPEGQRLICDQLMHEIQIKVKASPEGYKKLEDTLAQFVNCPLFDIQEKIGLCKVVENCLNDTTRVSHYLEEPAEKMQLIDHLSEAIQSKIVEKESKKDSSGPFTNLAGIGGGPGGLRTAAKEKAEVVVVSPVDSK